MSIQPAARKSRQFSSWRTRALVAILGLIALLCVIVTMGYGYWSRSLPQTDGKVTMAGLAAPVDVYRDEHGVPSIFAANRADALRALGYVHASERFFGMEMNRRAAQGRLAETVGRDMLPIDKLIRTLDLYRLAQQSHTHYRPETRALIQAYADGVNAWLRDNQHRLPLEFTLLGITPEPWQPADSIVWGKLMALRLSANMREELLRARLLKAQPAAVLERLYPAHPGSAPVTIQPDFAAPNPVSTPSASNPPQDKKPVPKKPSTPIPAPKQKSITPAQKQGEAPILPEQALARLAALWPWQTPGASNEWVIAGSRSQTGKPLLANDPHLGLEAPIMWYLARLVTPEGELTGATVPGLPVVLLGQNSHIAWGFTTTNSDVQDIFVETLDPKDPNRYLHLTESLPFTTRSETIKVKGEKDVTITVRRTRHGPVISDVDEDAQQALRDNKQVLALAFTGLGDKDTTPEALLDLNAARDWTTFQTALQGYQTPPQNIVYADREGHIGFTNPGLVPVRKTGDGRYPVDGASGAYDWRGMIPFTYVPRLFEPASGVIFNANNAVAAPGLYWLGREWDQSYRAERIQEVLKSKDKFSTNDFVALQGDTVSLAAKQLLPLFLAHIKPSGTQAETAITLLRKWDFAMRAERPEPLLFEWWLLRLYDQLVRPPFGKMLDTDSKVSAAVVAGIISNPAGWCDKLLKEKSRDCAPQIQAAFAQMLQELTLRYGAEVGRWRWSAEHIAPLENKVLGHVPGFNALFGLQRGSAGGNYTVNRGGNSDQADKPQPLVKTHGAGFRGIYDLADPSKSRFMTATGQSAHPLSRHYGDLAPLWNSDQTITISGTSLQLAAQNRGHLALVPGK